MADAGGLTPMMRQYRELKARHPREILFFRLGDFYEMFEEDAKTASRVLGLTLTSRAKGEGKIPMAGIPAHAAEAYLRRLLTAGHRVATPTSRITSACSSGVAWDTAPTWRVGATIRWPGT